MDGSTRNIIFLVVEVNAVDVVAVVPDVCVWNTHHLALDDAPVGKK